MMTRALLLLLLCAGPAFAQRPAQAPPVVASRPPQAPKATPLPDYSPDLHWGAGARSTELALYDGKDQVGAFCYTRGQFFPIRWGEWAEPCAPPIPLPAVRLPLFNQPPAPQVPYYQPQMQMMPMQSFGGFGGGGMRGGGGRSC